MRFIRVEESGKQHLLNIETIFKITPIKNSDKVQIWFRNGEGIIDGVILGGNGKPVTDILTILKNINGDK